VQKEVFPDHVGFRIRKEEISVPEVQEWKGEAADFFFSNHNFQKKLARRSEDKGTKSGEVFSFSKIFVSFAVAPP
jgi:hypothetical protein